MQRLWSYMIRYRGRYALGLACLLVTASLAMAVPYLLKRAHRRHQRGEPFRVGGRMVRGAIVAIALVQAVARTLSRAS